MKRDSYIFYRNWWETFRKLPNELRLEVYDNIMQYAFNNEMGEISVFAGVVIDMAKPLLDKDRAKYEAICQRNKANGLRGGRPRNPEKPSNNPGNPVGYLGSEKKTQENPEKPYNDKVTNDKVINDKVKDNIESNDSLSVVTDVDKTNYIEIVAFYNRSVEGRNITSCVKLTENRKAAIRARLKEFGREKVFEAITKVAESSFCNGRNDRNWKADFDFVFNANKMAKILEGKYDDDNTVKYGNNGNSNEQSIRKVGEAVLGDIFAEIEERRRIEGTAD